MSAPIRRGRDPEGRTWGRRITTSPERSETRRGSHLPIGWDQECPTAGRVHRTWHRWKQPIWSTVRFSYLVDLWAANDPIGVSTGDRRMGLGRASSDGRHLQSATFSAEKISETVSYNVQWDVPPLVNLLLALHPRYRIIIF